MVKTSALLLVSLSVLAACAEQEPAQSPRSASTMPTSSPASGTGMGTTEQMPSTSGSGTAYPAPGTPMAPPDESSTGRAPQTTATTQAAAPAPVAWTDGKILQVIHLANDGEIEQARLARTRASDPRVKQLAAMLIADHSAADEKTLAMARQSGAGFEPTTVSQNLETDARSNTSTLSAQSGSEFDREFVETQIKEHQAVLATIDDELMPAAQSADMKKLLTAVRAKIVMHLQRAQDLAAAMQKK